jgi:hypothetical protein
MAKAIRVVVLTRVKVDKGSGLGTCKNEEKRWPGETAPSRASSRQILYVRQPGYGYIHQSSDEVVSPYESPKIKVTSWRFDRRSEDSNAEERKNE